MAKRMLIFPNRINNPPGQLVRKHGPSGDVIFVHNMHMCDNRVPEGEAPIGNL